MGVRIHRGFTLLEFISVIAIIGILIALLTVAVSHARESSRRIECSNRLRQLGLGIQLHINATGYLPDSTTKTPRSFPLNSEGVAIGPLVQAIRYADGFANCYQQELTEGGLTDPSAAPLPKLKKPPNVFQCPSNSLDGTSYRANIGPHEIPGEFPGVAETLDNGYPGPFGRFVRTRASSVLRGLTHTAGFSETVQGVSRFKTYNFYFPHSDFPPNSPDRSQKWDEQCRSASLNGDWVRYLGMHPPPFAWNEYGIYYTHRKGPNSAFPMCYANLGFLHSQSGDIGFTATSNHSGGVNLCMLDGSVHFYNESVNLAVWQEISRVNTTGANAQGIDQ